MCPTRGLRLACIGLGSGDSGEASDDGCVRTASTPTATRTSPTTWSVPPDLGDRDRDCSRSAPPPGDQKDDGGLGWTLAGPGP
jgi:hypothetical protein